MSYKKLSEISDLKSDIRVLMDQIDSYEAHDEESDFNNYYYSLAIAKVNELERKLEDLQNSIN